MREREETFITCHVAVSNSVTYNNYLLQSLQLTYNVVLLYSLTDLLPKMILPINGLPRIQAQAV